MPDDSSILSSGWLCVNHPGDPVVSRVAQWFTSGDFTDTWGAHQHAVREQASALPPPRDYRTVFPWKFSEMRGFLKGQPLPELPEGNLQAHWYNAGRLPGHPWGASSRLLAVTPANWRVLNELPAQLFRESLRKAGDPWLDEIPPPAAVADPATAVFTDIYAHNRWTNGSGPGSHPDACRPWFTDFLPRFLKEKGIHTVLDWGCGDWQHSRYVDWSGVDYTGVDVVPSLVEDNNLRYGGPHLRFTTPRDGLTADLLILKDVAIHWPNDMIREFLGQRRARHVLIANSVGLSENKDIKLGGFRSFAPDRPPFNFGYTRVFEWPDGRGHKFVVWHHEQMDWGV